MNVSLFPNGTKVVNFLLMHTLKTTTIFLLLFLLSCTVTKRMHRPGFHIEWKKNYRVQSESEVEFESECESEMVSVEQDIDTVEYLSDFSELYESSAPFTTNEIRSESQSMRGKLEQVKNNHSEKLALQTHRFFVEKTRRFEPLKMPRDVKNAEESSSGYSGDGFMYVGYVLLGIAAFILIGALFSYFGFWFMENLFYSLVFSGNGLIAGILGFLLFLIILLFVFISYAIVHYLMGGAYIGFIVTLVLLGAGLLSLLIGASIR